MKSEDECGQQVRLERLVMPQGGCVRRDIELAKDLAHRAHAGQVDKAGCPYIEHVSRVAAAVADYPISETVAWLHDVLEDCADEYKNELLQNFDYVVFDAVRSLTRGKFSERTYYRRVSENPISLRVKLADIADNADESRLSMLDESTANRLRKKYAKAARMLMGHNA